MLRGQNFFDKAGEKFLVEIGLKDPHPLFPDVYYTSITFTLPVSKEKGIVAKYKRKLTAYGFVEGFYAKIMKFTCNSAKRRAKF